MAILLLGIISLMGDTVYEGSRGILPSYLDILGASALIVGLVGGLDILANVFRLISGFLADKTNAYWPLIFLGYALIASIPLLGIFTGLGTIVLLVALERLGKAIRAPARDTVLSVIGKDVGAGKAFGIHELLDQIGAVAGPLLVAAVMFYSKNNYGYTFSLLIIPFLILLMALVYTYNRIGSRAIIEPRKAEERKDKLTRPFYVYALAVLLNTAGVTQATLILFKASTILSSQEQWIVPLIYLLIQGVDAPAALLSGYAYDKFGIAVLFAPFLLSFFPALLTLFGADLSTIIMASIVFGLILGMQESIYRAAVSDLTPLSSRGTAYGIFNMSYGVGLFISGAIYGMLMAYKLPFIVVVFYVLVMQVTAIASLLNAHSRLKARANSETHK
jgi:MFS family permease